MSKSVRVRFAPSPTGYLHVGGARTALFNWLFARQLGGSFVLRMEDTDRKRNTPEARQTIFDGLSWLGLDPDEGPEQGGDFGPYSQSERGGIYDEVVAELKRRDCLYPCFCSKERLAELRARQERERAAYGYDGACLEIDGQEARRRIEAGEAATWRLRVPEGETVIQDLIRGEITVANADIEDIILIRADGNPVYNLVVVIDDHLMGITHVLRGEDHLTNTFKQVILFDALSWARPAYGHLPLILGPSGEGKLSKRKHTEAALEHYRARDYHPEAMINWLALIGWSFDDRTEIMTRQELIERFTLERVQSSGARLPLEKLDAMSAHYIREMGEEELADRIAPHLAAAGLVHDAGEPATRKRLVHLARVLRERLHCFSEVTEQAAWLFRPIDEYEPKAEKNLLKRTDAPEILRAYAASLPDPLPGAEELESDARAFAESKSLGFGQFVHPVRAALTGKAGGPPLFDCLLLLGREEAARRLEAGADRAADSQPHS